MNAARSFLRAAGQAAGTVLASSIPGGASVSSNAQGQLIDAFGNIIVDANGMPLTSMSQFSAAQSSNALALSTVQLPTYDASGNIVTDASGAPVLQTVPANSPLALSQKSMWMRGGAGALLALAILGAVSFGASYAGTRVAMKRSGHGDRRDRSARRSSRRSRTSTRELPI